MPKLVVKTTASDIPQRYLDQEQRDGHDAGVKIVRDERNHLIFADEDALLYSEDYGRRVWRLSRIPEEMIPAIIDVFKAWSNASPEPLRIEKINRKPATECGLARIFLAHGFQASGQELTLKRGDSDERHSG